MSTRLKTNAEVLAKDLADREFRSEWERTAVARLELGERTPTVATLEALARAIGLVVEITPSGVSVGRVAA